MTRRTAMKLLEEYKILITRATPESQDYKVAIKAIPTLEALVATPTKLRKVRMPRRYANFQTYAVKRDLDFKISYADFLTFKDKPCTYCGEPIKTQIGLDRVDNNKGYVLGNIVSCCGTCNMMKGRFSFKEFHTHILKLARRFSDVK